MTKPLQDLTRRQRDVLEYLIEGELDGAPRSVREIADHLGVTSTNGINDHLRALERKGYIVVEARVSRGIQVLRWPDGSKWMTLREALKHIELLEREP